MDLRRHMEYLVKKWLSDNPKNPEPDTVSKDARRGDVSYSITLRDGRMMLYRWHGEDYESVTLGGTAEDFNQFDEIRPEDWFDIAAKMIAARGKYE